VQLTHFLGDADFAIGDELDDADGEAAQTGNILGAMADAVTAAILVEVPVDHIVATVFDGPVTAIGGEDALWAGLFRRRTTGDSQSDLVGDPAVLFVKNLPLDQEDLADMRKVEVRIECCAAPDAPGFDTAVVGRCDIDKIRRLPILEEKGDIGLKRRLIAFGSEVIMRLAFYQVPLPALLQHAPAASRARRQDAGTQPTSTPSQPRRGKPRKK